MGARLYTTQLHLGRLASSEPYFSPAALWTRQTMRTTPHCILQQAVALLTLWKCWSNSARTSTLEMSQHARPSRMQRMAPTLRLRPCPPANSPVCLCCSSVMCTEFVESIELSLDTCTSSPATHSWPSAEWAGWHVCHAEGKMLSSCPEHASSCLSPGNVSKSPGRSGGGSLLSSPGSNGEARSAAPSKGGLTSSAAAQVALCNGSSSHVNGLVPVRTGLAWATLGARRRSKSHSFAGTICMCAPSTVPKAVSNMCMQRCIVQNLDIDTYALPET